MKSVIRSKTKKTRTNSFMLWIIVYTDICLYVREEMIKHLQCHALYVDDLVFDNKGHINSYNL